MTALSVHDEDIYAEAHKAVEEDLSKHRLAERLRVILRSPRWGNCPSIVLSMSSDELRCILGALDNDLGQR